MPRFAEGQYVEPYPTIPAVPRGPFVEGIIVSGYRMKSCLQ
jgi:hypothetical protein